MAGLVDRKDPLGIQAGLFEEVVVPAIAEGEPYPLMIHYGGRAGSFQVVGITEKRADEQMLEFQVRLADMEQEAIDILKKEGNLLNTLTIAGIHDSFACSQAGAQKAAQQGFEALKKLDVPSEELQKKVNKELYQDLVEYGRKFVSLVSTSLKQKEGAEK